VIGVAFGGEAKLEDLKEIGPGHFICYTPEGAFKWGAIHPEPDTYRFDRADPYVDFVLNNGMKIHGHTLLWFQLNPAWLFQGRGGGLVLRTELLDRMEKHIFTVCGHYRGKVYSWDVVNEALSDVTEMKVMYRFDDHKLYGVEEDMWCRLLGGDYIEYAFKWAHEADPTAKLYYNEYETYSPQTRAVCKFKQEKMVALVNRLRDKGLHIDGMGIQGHFEHIDMVVEDLEAMIRRFGSLGLKVSISELDIGMLKSARGKNPYPDRLPPDLAHFQARLYARLFQMLKRNAQVVERVTFWGVSDKRTWKSRVGRQDHPLLWDVHNQPKEAFYAVADPDGYLRSKRGG
jgi:endo-1,4-beta-xylanase